MTDSIQLADGIQANVTQIGRAKWFIMRQVLENPELLAPKFFHVLLEDSQSNNGLYEFCRNNGNRSPNDILLTPLQREQLKKAAKLDLQKELDKEWKITTRRVFIREGAKEIAKKTLLTGLVATGSGTAKTVSLHRRGGGTVDQENGAIIEAITGFFTAASGLLALDLVKKTAWNDPDWDLKDHAEKMEAVNRAKADESFVAMLKQLEQPLHAELHKLGVEPPQRS